MPIVDSCFDVVDPRRDVPGFQSVCLAAITFCSYCTSCYVLFWYPCLRENWAFLKLLGRFAAFNALIFRV